jgi:hypothetical protein
MLAELFNIQNRMVSGITLDFKRSLYETVNWNNRMIENRFLLLRYVKTIIYSLP